jgi:hypothetical protein
MGGTWPMSPIQGELAPTATVDVEGVATYHRSMSSCGHCGSNLTPADMSQPNCRYCGTVLAHYARAAEKIAVVNALMGDANHNGIPDVLEGAARLGTMPANLPGGTGQSMVVVHSAVIFGGGAVPPMNGGPMSPMGGGLMGQGGYPGQPPAFLPPMHGQPMGYPSRRGSAATVILVVVGVITLVGVLAGLVAFLFLVR